MNDRERLPVWVKILTGFHILAIFSWTLPYANTGVPNTPEYHVYKANDTYLRTSPIRQYLLTFGLWQSWDMFAPNPSAQDLWGDSVVIYRDGTERVVEFPRVASAPYWAKPIVERYRKYYERAGHESYAYLWPSLGQWVAYISADNPENPPTRVVIRRHLFFTPPTMTAQEYFKGMSSRQGAEKLFPPITKVNRIYPTENMFIWIVDQDELFAEKGWKKP